MLSYLKDLPGISDVTAITPPASSLSPAAGNSRSLMSSTRTNRFIIDDTVARLKAGELTPPLIQLWYLIPKLDPKPEGEDRSGSSCALITWDWPLTRRVYDKATEIFTDCLAPFGVSRRDTADLFSGGRRRSANSSQANRFNSLSDI
jgi:hypothetical protein